MQISSLRQRLSELGEQLLPGNQVIAFGVFMLFYLCLNWGPPPGETVLPVAKEAPALETTPDLRSDPPPDSLRYSMPTLLHLKPTPRG